MTTAQASTIAAVLTALVGLGGWVLALRAQRTSQQRQRAVDQGPFVDSLQGWSKEIVAWYQARVVEVQRECEAELLAQRDRHQQTLAQSDAEHRRALRRAEELARFWKERALGTPVDDATIPPELRP